MNLIEETDKRFHARQSTIVGAGLGCFASVEIKKGDFLEIIGVQVKYQSITDRCTHYANHYKFSAEPQQEFQHCILPLGYAALVNSTDNLENQNVVIAYLPKGRVKRNPASGKVVYLALRDIHKDEELLANYNRKVGRLVQMGVNYPEKDWLKLMEMGVYNLHRFLEK